MNPVKYLLSIESKGIKLGLERTEKIMESCGSPHIGLPCIQVAGTNGKGSVSAILASIFQEAGYKTGLFTSPHLVNLNERIRINGKPINNSEIQTFLTKYKIFIEKHETTFFETITAIAFWYFNKSDVDIAILETGLGGRKDSVSICQPILTVITPIALDHIEILGNTLEKIAYEKAGILKNKIQCISAKQDASVKNVLINEAKNRGAKINFIKTEFQYSKFLNIQGAHQQENAQLAIEALSHIKYFKISTKSIIGGLKNVIWFGRNQIIQNNPLIIFDVAHNAHGLQSFLSFFNSLNIKGDSILIIALQSRKDVQSVLSDLAKRFQYIICTEGEGRKPMSANKLASKFPRKVEIIKNPKKAILSGKNKLTINGAMAIVGSHGLGSSIGNVFKISFYNY